MVSIPQAVSTVATLKIYGCYAEGFLVSIPQAVSTVATTVFRHATVKLDNVSIPQAVSTVATLVLTIATVMAVGFNTASGKYCCNGRLSQLKRLRWQHVSIPQAVSTVATKYADPKKINASTAFQYRKR